MRGVDPGAQMRGVGRALGLDIEHDPVLQIFQATDPELERTFTQSYKTPSQLEHALDELHNKIYFARGAEVNRRQEGKCCFCGKKMKRNSYEIDHILSRGAHGRNDRIFNLRVCCAGLSGCDGHRIRHGNG